ncbi:MAG TPA: sugar phosphate isomerase/epimerase [Blastocatellia bacterium]|nr:sugar phosphate isomerase/epimerase [Blastocatellia bacterium]
MRIALNGATTMRADLATDIQVAHEAGFDLIEIWAGKLWDYLASHSLSELKQLFSEHGVAAYSINSLENITFRSVDDEGDLLDRFRQLCRIAHELECPYIVAVPSPRPSDVTDETITEESARVLARLDECAAPYGVQVAFEFLGFAGCSVRTLAHSWEIVKRVNRPTVGLVIDTFHFYVGGSSLASLQMLTPDRIFIVHINDAEDRPRAELEDQHRLLPGRGILPLREIIAGLRSIGYDGVISVEIFRPEYWAWDPIRLATEARLAAESILLPGQ